MRGQQERTGPLFSYISTEDRIPASYPLRQVPRLADQALDRLNPTFCKLYPEGGRPSIPPEQQLLALLLQAIYGIRSERMLIEQLDYNLLFRWFVGLNPDDPVWHPTTGWTSPPPGIGQHPALNEPVPLGTPIAEASRTTNPGSWLRQT